VNPRPKLSHFRTAEQKLDLELSWVRPDEEFFAAGACHILAHAFLQVHPNLGFSPLLIQPHARHRGGHVVVCDPLWAFDFNGFTDRKQFFEQFFVERREAFATWDADLVELKSDPADWDFCRSYRHRHPSQFFRDPVARALAYVQRFALPSLFAMCCGCAGGASGASGMDAPVGRSQLSEAPPSQMPNSGGAKDVSFAEPIETDVLADGLELGADADSPPPPWCIALTRRRGNPGASCETAATARTRLDEALKGTVAHTVADEHALQECKDGELAPGPLPRAAPPVALRRSVEEQDARLQPLESCAGLPAGFVRALRANLALACADALAADYLRGTAPVADAKWVHSLHGLALAGRLLRSRFQPPAFDAKTLETEEAERFIATRLVPWIERQERRVDSYAERIERLPASSYGGALARLALGEAHVRLYSSVRSVPIPGKWKNTFRTREAFYKLLTARTRDLLERSAPERSQAFAAVEIAGLLRSPIALELSRLIESHPRLKGLALLLLPLEPLPALSSDSARLAAALPPLFAAELLSVSELSETQTLRAAQLSGLAPGSRQALDEARLAPSSVALLARAHLTHALYAGSPRRARQAADVLRRATVGFPEASSAETHLLLAIAEAFGSFPDDTAELGPEAELDSVDVSPLTRIAEDAASPPLTRSLAALNAAVLRRAANSKLSDETKYLELGSRLRPEQVSPACVHAITGVWPFIKVNWCACRFGWVR
jgi:hypothetical protein